MGSQNNAKLHREAKQFIAYLLSNQPLRQVVPMQTPILSSPSPVSQHTMSHDFLVILTWLQCYKSQRISSSWFLKTNAEELLKFYAKPLTNKNLSEFITINIWKEKNKDDIRYFKKELAWEAKNWEMPLRKLVNQKIFLWKWPLESCSKSQALTEDILLCYNFIEKNHSKMSAITHSQVMTCN